MTIAELAQLTAKHPTLPTQFWGTSSERHEQVALCAEFSSLFKTELKREPADIPPLEIKFDRTSWEGARGNRLPLRPMNQENQAAARDIMATQQRLDIVSQNIINFYCIFCLHWKIYFCCPTQVSDEAHQGENYSQTNLVPCES
jgi:hypothetical protein